MTKILIGKVYAKWCGYCVSLKPEWKKMKNHIKNNYKHIQFIEAESSQISKIDLLKKKHNIVTQGYPTLFKILENGQIEYYKGPRSADDLIIWASGRNNRKTHKYMGGRKGTRKRKNRNYVDL
jgi:thiol-disulfide isomerase/thioredoxin